MLCVAMISDDEDNEAGPLPTVPEDRAMSSDDEGPRPERETDRP